VSRLLSPGGEFRCFIGWGKEVGVKRPKRGGGRKNKNKKKQQGGR